MCAYLCMRTTIDLPDALFRQAKAAAMHQGTSLKLLFTDVLRRALNEPRPQTRLMDRPPISSKGGSKIPPRTNEELGKILEKEETSKVR